MRMAFGGKTGSFSASLKGTKGLLREWKLTKAQIGSELGSLPGVVAVQLEQRSLRSIVQMGGARLLLGIAPKKDGSKFKKRHTGCQMGVCVEGRPPPNPNGGFLLESIVPSNKGKHQNSNLTQCFQALATTAGNPAAWLPLVLLRHGEAIRSWQLAGSTSKMASAAFIGFWGGGRGGSGRTPKYRKIDRLRGLTSPPFHRPMPCD